MFSISYLAIVAMMNDHDFLRIILSESFLVEYLLSYLNVFCHSLGNPAHSFFSVSYFPSTKRVNGA